ncbi:hypothetical protein AAFC00_003301 [Neodothiora populina]
MSTTPPIQSAIGGGGGGGGGHGRHDSTQTPRTSAFTRVSADLGHARSMSGADAARKTKRFSLTFPINTTALDGSATPSPTRPSTTTTTTTAPFGLAESFASPTAGPTDSTFLTAVAAQERRVLELKEELHKAEGELKRLKQEWALHEAARKRHDVRRVQRLENMNSPPSTSASSHNVNLEDDVDGSSAWMQQEMERRKALLNGTKTSNRTVFSGSRHARTLSLLSPTVQPAKAALQRDMDVRTRSRSPTAPERPSRPVRLGTDELLTNEVADNADVNIDLGLPRDVLMKTGKQMATDFRDGLWTFIEDLRQATVGDEGVNGTSTRTQSQQSPVLGQKSLRPQPSRGSLRPPTRPPPALKRHSTTSSKRTVTPSPPARSNSDSRDVSALIDLGTSFWRENGVDEARVEERPVNKKLGKKKSQVLPKPLLAQDDGFENWDNWDTPEDGSGQSAEKSNSSDTSFSTSDNHVGAGSRVTSRNTSVSSAYDGSNGVNPQQSDRGSSTKRESIPWPTLTKLAPSSLRRTASNLMADWEASVANSPVDEGAQQIDYMAGEAASPTGSFVSKDHKAG